MRKIVVSGPVATVLVTLMIAAPADVQTTRKAAGMEIEMQGRNVCRFRDTWEG